jgi:hypothetical protein
MIRAFVLTAHTFTSELALMLEKKCIRWGDKEQFRVAGTFFVIMKRAAEKEFIKIPLTSHKLIG